MTVMLGPDPSLATHLELHGPLPAAGATDVVTAVERAGLTGRGGAGFPTAVKLRAVAGAAGRPVVVANGAEGEPASRKDVTLLRRSPHLVLDGAQAAAIAVRAREIVLYVDASAVAGVERALAERRAAGRAAGAAPAAVRVVAAAAGFVAGQETAVVSALSGGPALPTGRSVLTDGVDGRPTLVQNVETLAQLGLLVRAGHDDRVVADTRLTTLWHADGEPRVHEVSPRSTLGELLTTGGWAAPSAVLLGGYHGRWLRPPDFGTPLGRAALGAGVVIPLAADGCGLAMTASVTGWLAGQSAGRCGPCRFGLPHLAGLVERLAGLGHPADLLPALHQATGLVEGRGACRHPDGTAGLVHSTLLAFADDVDAHARGHCLAAARAGRAA